jgi:UDPglucose 6-dehydrogenase
VLISVVGAGYVGLVTAACFAKLGHRVVCVDIDAERVEGLRRGGTPVQEPGLSELVSEGLDSGRLSFNADPSALRGTELAIVAVGTLSRDGEWTDEIVRRVAMALVRAPEMPRRLVIRSTLMPGSAASIHAGAREIDPEVEIAHNPEFTREATAVNDFFNPDRVVIGVADPSYTGGLAAALRHLYEPFDAPIVVTDLTSAETIKVASNVFLAAKVTFANELARLCAATGADVHAVVDGMGLDRRIGRQFMSPGPGFGGSCFPSQSRALPDLAERLGIRNQLMSAIWPSNRDQAAWFVERTEDALGRPLGGARVALMGVTFKAGTDDHRESPGLRLAERLAGRGAEVMIYDPSGAEKARSQLAAEGVMAYSCPDAITACTGADVIMVATEWPEFREMDWRAVAKVAAGRLIVDTRHVVDGAPAASAGFEVLGLGARAGWPAHSASK